MGVVLEGRAHRGVSRELLHRRFVDADYGQLADEGPPQVMERVLSEEGMDVVSLCRPFVRQPDLATRLKPGEIDRVG